ncbi:hypothetical protein ABEB36_003720 [Hypothenemus hampei]|uniref:Uncharacterized protein n=1 Tax=Hypothenemus hampei TaxID=57062 RepID=A0ABD1F265_HYPHA
MIKDGKIMLNVRPNLKVLTRTNGKSAQQNNRCHLLHLWYLSYSLNIPSIRLVNIGILNDKYFLRYFSQLKNLQNRSERLWFGSKKHSYRIEFSAFCLFE